MELKELIEIFLKTATSVIEVPWKYMKVITVLAYTTLYSKRIYFGRNIWTFFYMRSLLKYLLISFFSRFLPLQIRYKSNMH